LDRLAAMRLFTVVADEGSLSAAGRRLGIPLASVSRNLAALEQDLGVRLITRTTRHLSLTKAGQDYRETVSRMLEELSAAEARLAGEQSEPRGELAVTAPVAFGRLHVLPIVSEFLRRHAKVNVRLLLLDRPVDLIEEGLDVAIRIGVLPDSSLIGQRVGAVRNVICASPAYLRERGIPRSAEDLAAHDCITFSALQPSDRWVLTEGTKQKRVRVRSRLQVNTAEAAVDAAIAGLGIARVLSYQAAAALSDGSLREVLAGSDDHESPVTLLHREEPLALVKVRMFTEFASDALRKRMSALRAHSKKRAQK
jgi:DNA-binding transcriptional LysR family regulator